MTGGYGLGALSFAARGMFHGSVGPDSQDPRQYRL